MTTTDPCARCGRPADEHCEGYLRPMPKGCRCDAGTWGDTVSPICDRYEAMNGARSYRRHCEHDEACHGGASS